MKMSTQNIEELMYAKSLLESDSFAIKATSIIGNPIEASLEALPDSASKIISTATTKALDVALKTALSTISKEKQVSSWDKLHKLACATTGGAGGFFGMSALAIELPCSTTIMLRSIADIARSEGSDITSTNIELECISIFALGGPSSNDDAVESGYYAIRLALTESIVNATRYITQEGLKKEASPVIVKFIAEVASRFGIQVSQKVAAQAVPVIGAISGALINTIFIDHFQNKARGHFIIKRLERIYGIEIVKNEYINA